MIFGIGLWLNRILKQAMANWRLGLETAAENAKVDRRVREQQLSDDSLSTTERVDALKAKHRANMAEELKRAKQTLYSDYDRLSRELSELSDDPLDGRVPTSPHPVDLGRHNRRSGNGAAPQPPAYAPATSSVPDTSDASDTSDDPPPSTGKHAAKDDTPSDGAPKDKASTDAKAVEPEPAIMAQDTSEH